MECLKFIGTVHPRRLDQFIRNRLHVLLHHENSEAADHDGQDQGDVGVLKPRFHEHGIPGYDGDRPGNHHGHHDKSEDDIFAFKLIFSEYIAAQAACVDHDDRDGHGDKDTVQKISQEIKCLLEVQVVVHDRLLREQCLYDGLDLIVRLKGGEHHPHEREDSDDSQQSEHDV